MIKQWCWGYISAVQLRECLGKSYNDQVQMLNRIGVSTDHASKALKALASLGTQGRYDGNVAAQLKRWLGAPRLPRAHGCEGASSRTQTPKSETRGPTL